MPTKFRRIRTVFIICGVSIIMILFTGNLPRNIPEQVRSLNLSNFWVGSNADINRYPFFPLTYLFSDRMIFHNYKQLLQVHRHLETTFQCIGSSKNQSCLFKNLYYINSTFWILTTKKLDMPLPSVRIGAMVPTFIILNRRRFYTSVELNEFVRVKVNPIVIPDLTVYFEQLWLMNIGHALFDGLYPAYLALIRFPPRHLLSFRILLTTNGYNGNHSFSQNVYNRFAGLDTINASILEEMSIGRWFAFEELVMGSGDMCQRCLQANLQLPGGVELDGSRLFRERMYKQHGLTGPMARKSHSAERRDRKKPLQAVFIDNKRFTSRDRIEISAAIEEINVETDIHQRQSINNRTNSNWPLVHVSYISYSQLSTINYDFLPLHSIKIDWRTSKIKNKMIAQLQLLQNTDIHITGPGTGQMYQTFLSDGSVNINLGGLCSIKYNTTVEKYTSFLEQYMTSGTPYIKGLYYPINERPKGIRRETVIKLIREAAQLIIDEFSIPVNPNENLAPDGRLFIEMCELDRNFCMTVTDRWEKSHFWCGNTWPESIVYEDGPWSLEGIFDHNENVTCSLNRTLLHQLRHKYHINLRSIFPRTEQT